MGWSPTDEAAFAAGLRRHDRDFHALRKEFLPTKSMASIISYYYNIWKIRWARGCVTSDCDDCIHRVVPDSVRGWQSSQHLRFSCWSASK